MQEEISKHTKKIYKAAKDSNHSFWHKIKEILIEIFIIVFAVTLSIWLHNWSEHNHQKKEAKEFLFDIRDDLTKDMKSMGDKKENLSSILNSCRQILSFSPQQLDTASNISLNFSLNTFKANDGNYEGFKSSGKIGFIENRELKKLILEYYQESLPGLYDVDRYQYSKHLEVWEMINSINDGKSLSNPILRGKIILDAQITEALVRANDNVIEMANKIRTEIDKELGS